MVAEETVFRQESHKELEKMRSMITDKQTLTHKLRKYIRESKTDDSEPLERATEELSRLEETHQILMQQRKERDELSAAKKIKSERKRQHELNSHIQATRDALNEARAEHETLMAELKRLDFMVYGRRGKYQIRM